MDGTGSGSCLVVEVGISSVDPPGYAVREYSVFSYTSLT